MYALPSNIIPTSTPSDNAMFYHPQLCTSHPLPPHAVILNSFLPPLRLDLHSQPPQPNFTGPPPKSPEQQQPLQTNRGYPTTCVLPPPSQAYKNDKVGNQVLLQVSRPTPTNPPSTFQPTMFHNPAAAAGYQNLPGGPAVAGIGLTQNPIYTVATPKNAFHDQGFSPRPNNNTINKSQPLFSPRQEEKRISRVFQGPPLYQQPTPLPPQQQLGQHLGGVPNIYMEQQIQQPAYNQAAVPASAKQHQQLDYSLVGIPQTHRGLSGITTPSMTTLLKPPENVPPSVTGANYGYKQLGGSTPQHQQNYFGPQSTQPKWNGPNDNTQTTSGYPFRCENITALPPPRPFDYTQSPNSNITDRSGNHFVKALKPYMDGKYNIHTPDGQWPGNSGGLFQREKQASKPIPCRLTTMVDVQDSQPTSPIKGILSPPHKRHPLLHQPVVQRPMNLMGNMTPIHYTPLQTQPNQQREAREFNHNETYRNSSLPPGVAAGDGGARNIYTHRSRSTRNIPNQTANPAAIKNNANMNVAQQTHTYLPTEAPNTCRPNMINKEHDQQQQQEQQRGYMGYTNILTCRRKIPSDNKDNEAGQNNFIQNNEQEGIFPPESDEFKPTHPVLEEAGPEFRNSYLIGRKLGSGAYASVNLVFSKLQNTKHAMKTYEKAKAPADSHRRKSIMNEIEIMKKLGTHPHIVGFVDSFDSQNYINILMEFVDGKSMYFYLKSKPNRRLSEEKAKSLFRQVVSAIAYCHSLLITHRDIKLENLIIDNHSNIKLIDFGFSTCFPHSTKAKLFCGTPSYMAPEIVARKEYHGPPVDIWALGVLLYALLCGTFPFKGANDSQLYSTISKGAFVIPEHVSEGAASLIKLCLQIDPKKRPCANNLLHHWWLDPNGSFGSPNQLIMRELSNTNSLQTNSNTSRQEVSHTRHPTQEITLPTTSGNTLTVPMNDNGETHNNSSSSFKKPNILKKSNQFSNEVPKTGNLTGQPLQHIENFPTEDVDRPFAVADNTKEQAVYRPVLTNTVSNNFWHGEKSPSPNTSKRITPQMVSGIQAGMINVAGNQNYQAYQRMYTNSCLGQVNK